MKKHWRAGVTPANFQIKCIVDCVWCGKTNINQYYKSRMLKSSNFFCNASCQVKWQNKYTDFNKGCKNPSFIHGQRVNGKLANYGDNFTSELKRQVKIRDGYNCKKCNSNFSGKLASKLDVHHLDHNKYNNDMTNLICLCKSCHSRLHWAEGKIVQYGN